MTAARRRAAADLLGVSVDAPAAEIRRAFRSQVWDVHPDGAGRTADTDSLTQHFTDLCAARSLLLEWADPARRAERGSRRLTDFLAVFGQTA